MQILISINRLSDVRTIAMLDVLTINFSKAASDPFISLLRDRGVRYRERVSRTDHIYAATDFIQIMKDAAPGGSSIAFVVASAVVAFIRAKHGRKVVVTSNTGVTVVIENLTEREVAPIIENTISMMVIDPDNGPKR
jgi:hypothetical protein